MPEVVTIGETMVVFDSINPVPLRYAGLYERHTGGAETNVGVGIVRLGHSAAWITRLGNDEFGQYILSFYKGEGLDVSKVIIDAKNPTGIFFRQKSFHGESKNFYYRKESAASHLIPEDLDLDYIKGARYLHITGITPALSESCYKTVKEAMKIAKENEVKVSFDPNIRLKLWEKEKAIETINHLLTYTDIFLPGIDECEILFGTRNADEIFKITEEKGIETTVIKLGEHGAIAKQRGNLVEVTGYKLTDVIDTFGAGDAFAAGFLAGQLKNWSLYDSLNLANATGALSVSVPGNIEALPTLEQVERFIRGNQEINR